MMFKFNLHFRNKFCIYTIICSAIICSAFFITGININATNSYFTEKMTFGDSYVSILEEHITVKINSDYNTSKKTEYLIKNLGDSENVKFYFASDRNIDDIQVMLNDVQVTLKEIENYQEDKNFYKSKMIEIIVPLTKTSFDSDPYRINVETCKKIYESDLTIKKGDFATISLQYPSNNIEPEFIDVINPVKIQMHQFLPLNFPVSGATTNLYLQIPENFSYLSNINLLRRTDGSYSTTLNRNSDLSWNISFINTEGLIFMSNFINTHNQDVLKALSTALGLSVLLFLIKQRELTKNKKSEFAELKSKFFGYLSLFFYITSIGILYFVKLPSNFAQYWNLIYAVIFLIILFFSYVVYKNRDKFKFDFSYKEEN